MHAQPPTRGRRWLACRWRCSPSPALRSCGSSSGYVGSNQPVTPVLVEPPRQERRVDVVTTSPSTPTPTSPPGTLRLRLADSASRDASDGAWWPRTRDLQTEVADL